jgi:hypothetical protein
MSELLSTHGKNKNKILNLCRRQWAKCASYPHRRHYDSTSKEGNVLYTKTTTFKGKRLESTQETWGMRGAPLGRDRVYMIYCSLFSKNQYTQMVHIPKGM